MTIAPRKALSAICPAIQLELLAVWAELQNGALLKAAEDAGFDVMVSADKNICYQQNLSGRKIALVVLSRSKWSSVEPVVSAVVAAVTSATAGSYTEVTIPDDQRIE